MLLGRGRVLCDGCGIWAATSGYGRREARSRMKSGLGEGPGWMRRQRSEAGPEGEGVDSMSDQPEEDHEERLEDDSGRRVASSAAEAWGKTISVKGMLPGSEPWEVDRARRPGEESLEPEAYSRSAGMPSLSASVNSEPGVRRRESEMPGLPEMPEEARQLAAMAGSGLECGRTRTRLGPVPSGEVGHGASSS